MKKLGKILLIVILVIAIVVAAGFAYLYYNGLSGLYANTEAKDGQIKVACVGDSITYGHGIKNWKDNNYPAVLQKLLGKEYHVANFGSSGSCVNPDGDQPYIGRPVYQDSIDYEADILVLMLGTNDSKPENWISAESFKGQFESLLAQYLSGTKVPKVYIGLCSEAFYLDSAPSGLANFDIQPGIVDEIVSTIQEITEVNGISIEIVDIHALTTAHPEWFEKDGIHPNNDGAKAIAEQIAEVIN